MDEKTLRAMLAGHALQGFLSNRWRDMPHETSKAQIAAEAVRWADALLVELKKDSPAPAEESPPPGLTVPVGVGDVVQCDATGCDKPGDHVFIFHEHRVGIYSVREEGRFCAVHIEVRPESILVEWSRHAKKARAA